MICTTLLCLCIVVVFGLNLWALGYCFIHLGDSKEDNTQYWFIWTIYAVSIIFMLLLYKVKP